MKLPEEIMNIERFGAGTGTCGTPGGHPREREKCTSTEYGWMQT
jgi:hypothetical protein